MIAIAVCLSSHAYYQYFVELPQQRFQYQADPEGTLHEQGLYFPPESVERELFEQRLFSSEPTATFALTNSLAGFLAPWLVLLVAVIACCLRHRLGTPLPHLGAIAAAVWIGGCLFLTRSRTAYVAAGLGVVLVSFLYLAPNRRWGRRILVAATGLLVAALVAALLLSIADVQMLSEAPKSLLYRFQYWEGAVRIIADHPWFGCGPGNFQTCYAAYMLPEASEQVTDPHNFLFEIWATAGTPAMVLLLVAVALFAWRIFRPESRVLANGPAVGTDDKACHRDAPAERACRLIYLGGLCGVVVAYPIALIFDLMPDPAVLLLGVPLAAATVWSLHQWVVDGRLDARAVGIAAVVLLVNLLAAGGINFPGVAGSLWLFFGIALVLASPADGRSRVFNLSRGATAGVLLFVLLLLAFCYWTGYAPILNGRFWLERGEDLVYKSRTAASRKKARQQESEALACFEKAAAADPFTAEPWLSAAQIYHQQRLEAADEAGAEAAGNKFDFACGQAVRLSPRSHTTATEIGYMEFEAHDATGDRERLHRAREQLERAVQLFPNLAYAHARLAWMYHLEGNARAAAREAEEALRLDDLTPHRERKLRRRGIFDDLAAPQQLERLRSLPAGLSAEQLMARVRNVPGQAVP
jgi:hypothetical protein